MTGVQTCALPISLPGTAADALRDTARAVSRELGATAWPPATDEAVPA